MLCNFCSNIDLDQLAAPEGYKHHTSCANLFQSVQKGCESCELIWESQWTEIGGDLRSGYDQDSLDTQIIGRVVVGGKSEGYSKLRFGQDTRMKASDTKEYWNPKLNDKTHPQGPFLWSFVMVAASVDDRSSSHIRLRLVTQSSSENWLPLALCWLTECLATHKACSFQSSTKISPPTRVIDVGLLNRRKDPFLRISGDDIHQWVTLSHCWGEIQPLKTTMQTISAHEHALPLDKLSPLFRDAVLITRSLGYSYLWIDSLCIIQDSPDDWVRESANMGNIYKQSVLTIAADNCRDSRENILRNRSTIPIDYVKQRCHSSREEFRSTMHAFNSWRWEDLRRSDWRLLGSRAWALQEYVLSPRTLHWTPSQLVWSCRCLTRSEEDPTGSEIRTVKPGLQYPTKAICWTSERLEMVRNEKEKQLFPLYLWYNLVSEFLTRRITFDKDSLPAISGLAKEIKRHTAYDYHAGIWAQDYHNGLLWAVERRASCPSTYVAPSWSWAALQLGTIIHPALIESSSDRVIYRPTLGFVPIAEILETKLAYAGEDEFGQIVSGQLVVRAPFKLANSFEKNQIRVPSTRWSPCTLRSEPSTTICWLDDRSADGADEGETSTIDPHLAERDVAFVLILSSDKTVSDLRQDNNFALLLEPVAGDEWKRVGIARIAGELMDGWETRVFIII